MEEFHSDCFFYIKEKDILELAVGSVDTVEKHRKS